jgi:hypothetical protein
MGSKVLLVAFLGGQEVTAFLCGKPSKIGMATAPQTALKATTQVGTALAVSRTEGLVKVAVTELSNPRSCDPKEIQIHGIEIRRRDLWKPNHCGKSFFGLGAYD